MAETRSLITAAFSLWPLSSSKCVVIRPAPLLCGCRGRRSWRSLFMEQNPPPASKRGAIAELERALSADHPVAMQQADEQPQQPHSTVFQCVTSESEVLLAIDKEVEAGRLPPHAGQGMKDFYINFRDAVLQSELEESKSSIVPVMATVLDRILLQFEEPFTFPPYHQAMREPFDYYKFGQEYIRPLIQFSKSYLGNKDQFDVIEDQIRQGHNVILFSNHQTEADPAIIALLLETTHPYLAEKMTYIAGDRVVLDPFCKPFSMGRNLICVHSKKHINDEPELVEMKRRANIRALKELALLLRKGQQLIWIAPSGGRDRPDPATNEWSPAPFDPAAVDNMRRLVERGDTPGHMYPMALLSYNIMPPPPKVQKELGEKRLVGYHGVALTVANSEIDFQQEDCSSSSVWDMVREQYDVLHCAVHGDKGLSASTPLTQLSQPWT